MSESTTTTTTTSTPNAIDTAGTAAEFQPTVEQMGEMAARLAHIPGLARLWPGLSTDIRKGLAWDAAVVVISEGLDWAEYSEGLEEWLAGGDSVCQYLAEQWFPGPAGNVWAEAGSHLEAAKAWEALAGNKPGPDDDGPNPDRDATKAVQDAEAAKVRAEEQEQAARNEAHTTLQALVMAYATGERAYREGLLESGRLAAQYIGRRLALGDKRAAAVQAIEGQLAAVATDVVDVNRLVRCWAAWDLLAVGDLAKAAKDVPYGHYRDAWCLVVERAAADTATEHYRLLPGLEDKCRAEFKAALDATLSKAACVEKARALTAQHAANLAAQEKAAAQAKAQAAKAAQEQAEADRKARQAAEEQARQAELAARQAELAKQAAADEQARAEATAKAEAAKQTAEKARAEAEAKRFAEEQAAREAARTKAEAANAAKAQTEAEAKAAVEQGKAEKAAGKATQGTAKPKSQPSQAPKQPSPVPTGDNVIDPAAWADKPAKDVAEFLATLVARHKTPDEVLAHMLALLDAMPPAKPFAAGKASKRALQAALLVIKRGDAAPAGQSKPAA